MEGVLKRQSKKMDMFEYAMNPNFKGPLEISASLKYFYYSNRLYDPGFI